MSRPLPHILFPIHEVACIDVKLMLESVFEDLRTVRKSVTSSFSPLQLERWPAFDQNIGLVRLVLPIFDVLCPSVPSGLLWIDRNTGQPFHKAYSLSCIDYYGRSERRCVYGHGNMKFDIYIQNANGSYVPHKIETL